MYFARPVTGVVAVAVVLSLAPALLGDALETLERRGTLRWGGDQEGGGPYVYPHPDAPERVIGFEVELAELLAHHFRTGGPDAVRPSLRAEFFQGDWDTLPQFLRNGDIDIILNGYEWTPERAARMRASRPYYIYELQLLARSDDARIQSWDDLQRQPGRRRMRVSGLAGSAAVTYLSEHWSEHVEIVAYDGNTNAMAAVRNGVDDATLQDLPIAIFYRNLPPGRGLRFVGEPVGRGYYVMYARPDEHRLVDAINQALEVAIASGELRSIYQKYGLWNATQEELATAAPLAEAGKAVAGLEVARRYAPILLRAAGMTVFLSVAAMPLAIITGLLVALGRMYGPAIVRVPLTAYVEALRGTPIMLQLFVIFFILPEVLPFSFNPVVAAILGLAINYSAYEAEIYRAGLQAVPAGQMDAALALGMTRKTALRRIIVPQAVRIVIPPVTNDFIALFKDTSICSVIAVTELTKQYNMLANSTGAILELAAMTAALYLMMSYPLAVVAARMERRLGRGVPAR